MLSLFCTFHYKYVEYVMRCIQALYCEKIYKYICVLACETMDALYSSFIL